MKKHLIFDELRSITTTVISFVVVDGAAQISRIWEGDFSKEAFYALMFIVARSLVKVLLSKAAPNLFPVRKSIDTQTPEA